MQYEPYDFGTKEPNETVQSLWRHHSGRELAEELEQLNESTFFEVVNRVFQQSDGNVKLTLVYLCEAAKASLVRQRTAS